MDGGKEQHVIRIFWPAVKPSYTRTAPCSLHLYGFMADNDVVVTNVIRLGNGGSHAQPESLIGAWHCKCPSDDAHQVHPDQKLSLTCFGCSYVGRRHCLPESFQLQFRDEQISLNLQVFLYGAEDWTYIPTKMHTQGTTTMPSFSRSLQLLAQHHYNHSTEPYIALCSGQQQGDNRHTSQEAQHQTQPQNAQNTTNTNSTANTCSTRPRAGGCLLISKHVARSCSALQRILGIVCAWYTWMYWRTIVHAITVGAADFEAFAEEQTLWFMTARPGGIKLHAESCQLLGSLNLWWLGWMSSAAHMTYGLLVPGALYLAVLFGVLKGAVGVCNVVSNVVLIVALPIALLHHVASLIYRLQLRGIHATWRMMRSCYRASKLGQPPTPFEQAAQALQAFTSRMKARRVKRNAVKEADNHNVTSASATVEGFGGALMQQEPKIVRADESLWGDQKRAAPNVVLEEVFVGVLLFVPLLALLPTTLAWHTSVCVLQLACMVTYNILDIGRAFLVANPLLLMCWASVFPHSFAGDVAVDVPKKPPTPLLRVCTTNSSGPGSDSCHAAVRVYQLWRMRMPASEILHAWWLCSRTACQRSSSTDKIHQLCQKIQIACCRLLVSKDISRIEHSKDLWKAVLYGHPLLVPAE